MKTVPDASAVIAFLRDEPGADQVHDIISHPSDDTHIHAVNLLEVYYKLASYGGEAVAKEAVVDLANLGIQTHEMLDAKLRTRAGYFKIRYPFLSLADSICIALGEQLHAAVITTDRPFANVKDGVKINLMR